MNWLKQVGIKVWLYVKQSWSDKWNQQSSKENWKQISKLAAISFFMVIIYVMFFYQESSETNVITASTNKESEIPEVVRIIETGDFSNLDSALVNDPSALNVLNNVMEGLMRLDLTNKPTNGMAESFQVSNDYKIYTFTIRKDAKWNDGKSVTANDFYYAWMRAMDPKVNSKNGYLFNVIKNAKEYRSGNIDKEKIGLKVVSPNQIQIELELPNRDFLTLVSHPAFFPQREDIVLKYGNRYGTDEALVFNGPFKIKINDPDGIELSNNDVYWDKRIIKLKGVKFFYYKKDDNNNLYSSDMVDLAQISKKYVEIYNRSDEYIPHQITTTQFLKFNTNSDSSSSQLLRKSIANELDKEKVIKANFEEEGEIAFGLIPEVLRLEKPKKKLDKSQSKKEYLNKSLKIICNSNPSVVNQANEIADQLKNKFNTEVVVDIKKTTKDFKEAQRENDFDLALTNWLADYHDPLTFLDIWKTGVPENTSHYSNKKFDQLVDQAHQEIDPQKQSQLISEAEQLLINEDVAVIPLYHKVIPRLQKPYVKNVVYHPYGAEYSLKWAEIKK